jgi:hypothetical protein
MNIDKIKTKKITKCNVLLDEGVEMPSVLDNPSMIACSSVAK